VQSEDLWEKFVPEHPPENMPRITPYLLYQDVAAAIEWLAKAFDFRERMRVQTGSDPRSLHAEMEFADGVVMMGCPGPGYRNPKNLGQVTQNLYVYVDDVDMHYRRSKEAGALIIEEPADQPYGDRRYGAEDPEGHLWYFAQHVRESTARQRGKIDFDAVLEIARSLPGVEGSASSRGIGLKVRGKLFACTAIHKSAEPNSLMIRIGLDERELLLATEPDTYYLTDHYRGYPAVLVRLSKTDRNALRDLLEDAVQFVAKKEGRSRT
jgi:PhnB protein